nr:MAG: nucleocapsid [Rhipicephalus associated rhabdo-like virus]
MIFVIDLRLTLNTPTTRSIMTSKKPKKTPIYGESLFGVASSTEIFEGVTERRPAPETPDFPSDWFARKPEKPTYTILCSAEKTELNKMVYGGLKSGNLDIDLAAEYLVSIFPQMKGKAKDQPWTSFGVTIAEAGAEISPLSLITVVEEKRTAPTPGQIQAFNGSDLFLVTSLACVYRLALLYTRTAHEEYIKTVRSRMINVMSGSDIGGTFADGVLQPLMLKKREWATNRTFRGLMAAIDMYLMYDKDSPWQLVRMGTIVSRGKDCAALGDVQRIARCLSMSPSDSLLWVFETSMLQELQWLTARDEELGKSESYYHYCADFSLINRSPWSGTMCKQIHLWANCTCILLHSNEAMTTRYIECENVTGVVHNAIIVAYAHRGTSDARRLMFKTREEAVAAQAKMNRPIRAKTEDELFGEDDEVAPLEHIPGVDEPMGRDVSDWVNFMFGLHWILPDHILEWATRRVKVLKTVRDGSNLEFLRKYLEVGD